VSLPATVFAVNAGVVATPFAFVVTVALVMPPGKVPLAPLAGAVKVMGTPLVVISGSLAITVTTRGCAKAVVTVAF